MAAGRDSGFKWLEKTPLASVSHLVSGGWVHWGWDLVSKASRSETPFWETSSEGEDGPAMVQTGPQDWRGLESRARVMACVMAPPTSGAPHLRTCGLAEVVAEAVPAVPSVETRNFCI